MRETLLSVALLVAVTATAHAAKPVDLLMSPEEAAEIRSELGRYPMFDAAFEDARARVEKALASPIDVPVPADGAAYTHERHKQNYNEMHLAGILYQITGDERYAAFIREQLRRYADLYPTLGSHPAARANGGGRLFWQVLNETAWLVHTSQAYNAAYDTFSEEARAHVETRLFRPMALFLSEERAHDLDRMHNHGTWAATAVGMIGYVLRDETLVKKALYGSRMDGTGGWFLQLEKLISPDGLYVEGPYYGRYALWPFFVFAEVIERNEPGLKVYERAGSRLAKALHTLIQLSYVNGEIIPFNDALKEKTYHSQEAILELNITFARFGEDPHLLSIAKRQSAVSLSPAGFRTAKALAANPEPPEYPYASLEFRDGPEGELGGVGVLRSGEGRDQFLGLMKYTSLGMGHGHYDKLSLLTYDQGEELLPDYGAVRFLNIEQKGGGRYLPENESYASQTIAHNTVTVDGRSHYKGDFMVAEDKHSVRHFFDASDPDFQVMSARDLTAVPGVAMQRTVAMVRDPRLTKPVLVDVFRLTSDEAHQYDYPIHFNGHFLATNVDYKTFTDSRHPLGSQDGYQHLWVEAEGRAKPVTSLTWLLGKRFYTVTTAATENDTVYFTRLGANDPRFNLRPETAMILRTNAASHTFATVIEPHGIWDPTAEFTAGNFPTIREVKVLASTPEGTLVRVSGADGLALTVMISNRETPAGAHSVDADGKTSTWEGSASISREYSLSSPKPLVARPGCDCPVGDCSNIGSQPPDMITP